MSVSGTPHYEVIGRYGCHETVIARLAGFDEAVALRNEYRGQYPEVFTRYRAF